MGGGTTCLIGTVAGVTVQYHHLAPSHFTLGLVWYTTRPTDPQDFSDVVAVDGDRPTDDPRSFTRPTSPRSKI